MLKLAALTPTRRFIAGGLVLGAIGVGAYVEVVPADAPAGPPIALQLAAEPAAPALVREVVREPAPPAAKTRDVSLVFAINNATYMKLDAAAMPKHGKATLISADYMADAIAPVTAPTEAQRAWLGKTVRLDTGCVATVSALSVITRVSGEPSYSSEASDGTSDSWTARNVVASGTAMLAAKLEGCTGGMYARDAALPSIARAQTIENPTLAAAAKSAALHSAEAKAAQVEFDAWTSDMGETRGTWSAYEGTEWTTQVVVHPVTHETFVAVHASAGFSCGGPSTNLWVVYRVAKDGTLAQVRSALGDIADVDALVDLDSDGELEIIGRPYLGGRMVNSSSGEQLQALEESFFGCPC